MPLVEYNIETYHCDSCDYSTDNSLYFDRHLNSKWHKESRGVIYPFTCKLCKYRSKSEYNYTRHIKSKPHILP